MHLPYDPEMSLLYRGVKWKFMFKQKPINKVYTTFIHNHQKTGNYWNVLRKWKDKETGTFILHDGKEWAVNDM